MIRRLEECEVSGRRHISREKEEEGASLLVDIMHARVQREKERYLRRGNSQRQPPFHYSHARWSKANANCAEKSL